MTVLPVKSETGPIDPAMGKLLWVVRAWFSEIENEERTEAIKAGQVRAIASGKKVGRPKATFDREQVVKLRDVEGLSWARIAQKGGCECWDGTEGPCDVETVCVGRLTASTVDAIRAVSRS